MIRDQIRDLCNGRRNAVEIADLIGCNPDYVRQVANGLDLPLLSVPSGPRKGVGAFVAGPDCPECGGRRSRVVQQDRDEADVIRRRECRCGHRFLSYEISEATAARIRARLGCQMVEGNDAQDR